MRIVINAASAKVGGAVTYISGVLHALPGPESGHEFEVYLPPETARGLTGLTPNVDLIATGVGHAPLWKRVWWEQVTLRRRLRKGGADVLFSSGGFGMFRCPVRQVLLVCNALYFSRLYWKQLASRYPLKKKVNFLLRRWHCRQSVRAADVVMTPTRAELEEIHESGAIMRGHAFVNPYGLAPDAVSRPRRAETSLAEQGTRVVRLLYVSFYYDHKNLATLLHAVRLLNGDAARASVQFRLKTTANPSWTGAPLAPTQRDDAKLVREDSIAPWVEFVGPFSRDEARRLYADADLFVFPSLTESFGNPMVEAMAAGLPIVASDIPVNREICGDAAEYFSPLSAEELAGTLRRVAADPALRRRLSEAGRRRARAASRWDQHVSRIMEAVEPEVRSVQSSVLSKQPQTAVPCAPLLKADN